MGLMRGPRRMTAEGFGGGPPHEGIARAEKANDDVGARGGPVWSRVEGAREVDLHLAGRIFLEYRKLAPQPRHRVVADFLVNFAEKVGHGVKAHL